MIEQQTHGSGVRESGHVANRWCLVNDNWGCVDCVKLLETLILLVTIRSC